MKLAICIPVHGFSDMFGKTLEILANCDDRRIKNATIIISNSGAAFDENCLNFDRRKILNIPENFYWAKAVETLYMHCIAEDFDKILLMNHDCHPATNTLKYLLDLHEMQCEYVLHPAILDAVSKKIIWAGVDIKFCRRPLWKYLGNYHESLPTQCYETDCAPAQMLLLPRTAVRPECLKANYFPHYFSDFVQTRELQRIGIKTMVVPGAIAYSNEGDYERKRFFMDTETWPGVFRAFFDIRSQRNLRIRALAPFFLQNNCLGALIQLSYHFPGSIVKTILERLSRA
jgi:GT2 family glycosyltransferase